MQKRFISSLVFCGMLLASNSYTMNKDEQKDCTSGMVCAIKEWAASVLGDERKNAALPAGKPGRVEEKPLLKQNSMLKAPNTPPMLQRTPLFPLTALNEQELDIAIAVVKTSSFYKENSLFDRVQLLEPTKAQVATYMKNKEPIPRKAYVTFYNPRSVSGPDAYYEFDVELGANVQKSKIIRTERVPGAKPAWSYTDNNAAVTALLSNGEYRRALNLKGITDEQIDNGQVQPYTLVDGRMDGAAANVNMPPRMDYSSYRSMYMSSMFLPQPPDENTPFNNMFVYNVPGLFGWTNLNGITPRDMVVKVVPGERAPLQLDAALINVNYPPNPYAVSNRGTQKVINISMPNGPSWKFENGWLTWERWKMFVRIDPTIGLILNYIQYNDIKQEGDAPNWRTIIYQVNMHEAITTYGNDKYGDRNMTFLDFYEYPYSRFASPIDTSIDALPHAKLFGTSFADETGSVYRLDDILAIYEKPTGKAVWRHWDYATGVVQGRPGRNLVVETVTNVGNYDYNMKVEFGLAGDISLGVEPSGMNEMISANSAEKGFRQIYKDIWSSNHTHFFGYKIVWWLDEMPNRFYEKYAVRNPDNENISGGAWDIKKNQILKSSDSAQNIDPLIGRHWEVCNHHPNDLGNYPGFSINVETSVTRFAKPETRLAKRTGPFLENAIYASQYRDNEPAFMGKFPVEKGEYPRRPDDDLNGVDGLVTWVTSSFLHEAKQGDMPVLPTTHHLSIKLEPDNFFRMNTAMDADTNTNVDPTASSPGALLKSATPQKPSSYRTNYHQKFLDNLQYRSLYNTNKVR